MILSTLLYRAMALSNSVVLSAAALVMVALALACSGVNSQQQPLVPAMFIFGDSLVDDGNNNYIPSLARSNFYPYGIDFPLGHTGRFCNGRTVLDVLGEYLGLPFLPAYLNPATTGQAILRGVNYASAAGGILDASGKNYVARLSFNVQLRNFQNTLGELNSLLGGPGPTADFLSKSLFSIVFGSNDYLNNYIINSTGYSQQYTPDAYRVLVADQFAKQLTTLYQMGARKFLVAGVGPLGCIPNVLATKSTDGQCVAFVNDLVQGFNAEVLQMVNQLNADPQLAGATFLYGKTYDVFMNIMSNADQYGFSVINTGCCGVGAFNGKLTCILAAGATLCSDRQDHIFWDAFHPTQAFNYLLGKAVFSGGPDVVVPMNVQQLVQQN